MVRVDISIFLLILATKCSADNECQHKPCHPNAVCVYTNPGYSCNCLPGFHGDGYTCADIDECRTLVCDGYRTCRNTPGSYECIQGYHKNTQGRGEHINKCEWNMSDCKKGERCWNTVGSFKCCPNDKILDKNGNCACPDHYINYDKLGCVYIQCLNTSCGLGAMCIMVNAKTQCQCPNGTTGDPYEECAIAAESGLSPNKKVRESNSLEPSINILLYVSKTDKSLKHFTTVDDLILDQNFTIRVRRNDVDFTIREKQTITCYKKKNRAVIHVNKTEIKSAGSQYIAQGPKARASMNGNWECLITTKTYADVVRSKGPTKPSTIAIEFPVTINKAPVTQLPTKLDGSLNEDAYNLEAESEKDKNGCSRSPSILIVIIVTILLTSILNIVIFKVCVQRRFNKARVVDQGLPNPTVDEPYYETVDSSNDVSQRAPCPLPEEELEENKKYVHYDTPYEWRIWRFGVNPYRRAQP